MQQEQQFVKSVIFALSLSSSCKAVVSYTNKHLSAFQSIRTINTLGDRYFCYGIQKCELRHCVELTIV